MLRFLLPLLGAALCAGDAPAFKVFDGKPKRIVFYHSSHQGSDELEKQLKLVKVDYLAVQPSGGSPFEFSDGGVRLVRSESLKPKTPGELIVAYVHFDGPDSWAGYQRALAGGASATAARQQAGARTASVAATARRMMKDAGAAEVFIVGNHYHASAYGSFGPGGQKRSEDVLPPDPRVDFAQPAPWIDPANAVAGRTWAFDGRYLTRTWYPFIVHNDGRHHNQPRIAAQALAKHWIETVSAEEGTPLKVPIDIDALYRQSKAMRTRIRDVAITGDLRPGGTATITWKADPAIQTVSVWLYLQGWRAFDPYDVPYVDTETSILVDGLKAAEGSWSWTIPAEVDKWVRGGRTSPKSALTPDRRMRVCVLELPADNQAKAGDFERASAFCSSPVFSVRSATAAP